MAPEAPTARCRACRHSSHMGSPDAARAILPGGRIEVQSALRMRRKRHTLRPGPVSRAAPASPRVPPALAVARRGAHGPATEDGAILMIAVAGVR